ncbi:Hpt domain-containing protein [Sinorhizobium numidicum]|uniref:Hpt domain-containing protein n=1 Tax=Sinorhizobium numidicum TaxID=680248 RepID=A0ABY8CWT9_9HYPH|nr:Hpt domain-containing protein [Sinorhizobium numidicum]WEX75938.1 Hpt domain-containing protein [Sinorhizobium numidicum]WEX82597.1 Hpt domain-containing protein [Sinorhizobium numidicum]
MAAAKIDFEALDNAGRSSASKGKPIDFVHLDNQTMGDKALESEVLQLFARQARQAMIDIAGTDSDRRSQAAHRLNGAALAVGAVNVAKAAAAIERDPADATLQSTLSVAVLETELFILKLCR